MAQVIGGPVTWGVQQDDDGYRSYKVTWRVQAAVTESPYAVLEASGLPGYGTPFQITGYTGVDNWVWCRPERGVRIDQEKSGDPAQYYLVECTFGNKVEQGKSKRCNNTPIEDPLLEPMKVGGSFSKAQWEARYDQNGARLVTSANQAITGAAVTFDYTRPVVRIEQNVASLGLSTFAAMVNTVNQYPLWGLPARCIKLTNAPWERKYYGQCSVFYTRTFEFEIDYFNCDKSGNPIGFDREIDDSGSMVLAGAWDTAEYMPSGASNPNYCKYVLKKSNSVTATDPATILTTSQINFQAYKDLNNESARVLLDGAGHPANAGYVLPGGTVVTAGDPATAVLKYYRESNFLQLGIPTSW